MTAALLAELEEAQAKVARLQREIAAGPCKQYGHNWAHIGGCNAGCSDSCSCLVPVHECTKCGDCDYGDNPEASRVKKECHDFR